MHLYRYQFYLFIYFFISKFSIRWFKYLQMKSIFFRPVFVPRLRSSILSGHVKAFHGGKEWWRLKSKAKNNADALLNIQNNCLSCSDHSLFLIAKRQLCCLLNFIKFFHEKEKPNFISCLCSVFQFHFQFLYWIPSIQNMFKFSP